MQHEPDQQTPDRDNTSPQVNAVAEFARAQIAGRHELYEEAAEFPYELWQAMGEAGILGLGIPREYGGGGADYRTLILAGEALVRGGRNLGLAVAWLSHTLISRLIIHGQGDKAQRQQFLPALAAGHLTPSVAISEPDAGAHPKRLKSRAERGDTHWRLNGEKAWLTNGPIAGLYVVLAISDVVGGRKQFSAFLVPRDTPGLTQTRAGAVDFLRPARHGGLRLDGCAIPNANLLGPEGEAFETISKPLREVEDAVALGTALGGRAAQLELLVRSLDSTQSLSPEQLETLGGLYAMQEAIRTIAFAVAQRLDGNKESDPTALILAARRLSRDFQTDFSVFLDTLNLPETADNSELIRLTGDMAKSGGLASNVDRAKQGKLAKSMIMKVGRT